MTLRSISLPPSPTVSILPTLWGLLPSMSYGVLLLAICMALASAAYPPFPLYKQCDPRWGSDQMGVPGMNAEDDTICGQVRLRYLLIGFRTSSLIACAGMRNELAFHGSRWLQYNPQWFDANPASLQRYCRPLSNFSHLFRDYCDSSVAQ